MAETVDGQDTAGARTDTALTTRGADSGPGPPACAIDAVLETYTQEVRPFLGGCRICHDMTVPAALLKAPGPQWFHPADPGDTVAYLLGNGLVHATDPPMSVFLLKPLPDSCGGLSHTGGDAVLCDSAAHGGILVFLDRAAPCVGAPAAVGP